MNEDLYDIALECLDGAPATLAEFRGRVLLIVNVASRCGLTPQYAGLERLWQQYGVRGLVVLGFPCNQFGGQEPGTPAEIESFCRSTYDVSFPLYARLEVNGAGAHPLYRLLKEKAPGFLGSEAIKWNFTKFIVDRHGTVVSRHAPTTPPQSLIPEIETLLASD